MQQCRHACMAHNLFEYFTPQDPGNFVAEQREQTVRPLLLCKPLPAVLAPCSLLTEISIGCAGLAPTPVVQPGCMLLTASC